MRKRERMKFVQKVYRVVKRIPRGKVATYGQIAVLAGSPLAARAVGNALHRNPDPKTIPCHRVVRWDGKLAKNFGGGGRGEQKRKLETEGVTFKKTDSVDLEKCLWEE